MKIIRWAAIAVTALFVLMNLGAAIDPEQADSVQAAGGVLAVLGIAAVLGLVFRQSWGRLAVIGVGALNVVAGVAAIVADEEGGAIGIVVGGLGAVLGALTDDGTEPRPASAHR
ncbi:hypothetical protein [Nocardioides sp. WS12]|uniref:hypothetical protein n=1 Tax=Nocardioides sp. WS12 TaxID=2486272 RepID=UPI0015FBE3C9|nr:hypothetical protein [Nocardioides sp. WS12]